MGKKSATGGVIAAGRHRIRFDFSFEGRRFRPSMLQTPTETNLRRARQRLAIIKERIAAGTFSFADEFPDFRDLKGVPGAGSSRTCGQVFDAFLAHCESRMRLAIAMAPSTITRMIATGVNHARMLVCNEVAPVMKGEACAKSACGAARIMANTLSEGPSRCATLCRTYFTGSSPSLACGPFEGAMPPRSAMNGESK